MSKAPLQTAHMDGLRSAPHLAAAWPAQNNCALGWARERRDLKGAQDTTGDDSNYPEWQSWEVTQQSGQEHRFGRQRAAWGRICWRGWSRQNASSSSWNKTLCWRKTQRQQCCPGVRSGYHHRPCQRERHSCHLASDTHWVEIRPTLRWYFRSASYGRWMAKQSWDQTMNKMIRDFLW